MSVVADLRVLGIDPGPTPGLVVLDLCNRHVGAGTWLDNAEVVQCSAGLIDPILTKLLGYGPALVQVEAFVHSRKGRAGASSQTRAMVEHLRSCVTSGTPYRTRPAVEVKAWATDDRLQRAGLWDLTKGMTHARDAARQALYAACRDGGLPDPLSKEWSQ